MQIRKYRWSRAYESAEEELVQLLASRRIQAQRWVGEAGEEVDRYFATDAQLWCAEGSLTCTVKGKTYSLQPGDALDIPESTSADLRIGFSGCVCYESVKSEQ